MVTADEVGRRDAKMAEKPCFKFCLSCEGCANFTSNRQQCINCAPEYRRCICCFGIRRFLTKDGFIAIKEFGLYDTGGLRRDMGSTIRLRQVTDPLPPNHKREIPERFNIGGA